MNKRFLPIKYKLYLLLNIYKITNNLKKKKNVTRNSLRLL